ncbi:TPA: hypothetical protein QDB28_006491 [Burkholderia vietnamiensis]|nr:hypothetical protein [Burkholderia vietnamiensis]
MKLMSYIATRAVAGLLLALATNGAALLLHSPQAGSYPLFLSAWLGWSAFSLTIPDPPQPKA